MNKMKEGLSTLNHIYHNRKESLDMEMSIDFLYRKINTLLVFMTTLFTQKEGETKWT